MKRLVLNYLVIAAIITVAVMTSCVKDNNEGGVKTFALGPLQKILDGYTVLSISFDSKGNTWIGLLKWKLQKVKFNIVSFDTMIRKQKFIIPTIQLSVYAIKEDAEQRIWIGTENGIYIR